MRLDGPPERRVAQAMEIEGLEPRATPSACARTATAPARPTCATSTAATRSDPALYHLVIDSTALSKDDRRRGHRGRGALRFVGALEGLRGYAALLMVVYHAWVLTGGPLLGGGRAVLSGGFLAVDLFFVLSAFVLTLPAARTGRFGSWRDYALRRAARIVPAYYVALADRAGALSPAGRAPPPTRRPPTADALLAHLSFLQVEARLIPGYDGALGFRVNPALWTLSVEVAFYVVLPLVVMGFLRRPLLWLLIAVAGTVAAARAGARPRRRGDPGPPALAAADVRRRLRGRDGGRVAVRPRGGDSRLDGGARARRRARRAVGVRGADRRRGPARRAPVAVAGGGDAGRVRRARLHRRGHGGPVGRQPRRALAREGLLRRLPLSLHGDAACA